MSPVRTQLERLFLNTFTHTSRYLKLRLHRPPTGQAKLPFDEEITSMCAFVSTTHSAAAIGSTLGFRPARIS